jgi:hypothetical protein
MVFRNKNCVKKNLTKILKALFYEVFKNKNCVKKIFRNKKLHF